MSEIDAKIRAIYHLMLNEHIFVEEGHNSDTGLRRRYVWTNDKDAADVITRSGKEQENALDIAKKIARSL